MLAEQRPEPGVPLGEFGVIDSPVQVRGVGVHAEPDTPFDADYIADVAVDVGALSSDLNGDVLQGLPLREVVVLPGSG